MELHTISLGIFSLIFLCCIFSIHKKVVISQSARPIWAEIVTLLIATIVHVIFASITSGSIRMTLDTTITFTTILFGIIAPILSLLFPGETRLVSIFSLIAASPFTFVGLVLHLFNVIDAMICVYYFAIPAVIGLGTLLFVDRFCEIENEPKPC